LLAFAWWDDPARQRLQALFREAVAEVGAAPPPHVPAHSTLRCGDAAEFRRLLEGAGLVEVEIRGHQAEHHVRDAEALWEGGIGSLAMTSSAVIYQPEPVQARIRAAFERRAAAYGSGQGQGEGLTIPIAFLIGRGRKPVGDATAYEACARMRECRRVFGF
jgi:hypothetical protein